MEKSTEEKVSAAVLRLRMINAGVVQLQSVKTLEEEILEIDKKLEKLNNERKIKSVTSASCQVRVGELSFCQ